MVVLYSPQTEIQNMAAPSPAPIITSGSLMTHKLSAHASEHGVMVARRLGVGLPRFPGVWSRRAKWGYLGASYLIHMGDAQTSSPEDTPSMSGTCSPRT